MNKKYALILAFLLAGLVISEVYLIKATQPSSSLESVIVSRVIDGDTLKLEDGRTIRLLNINSPEKGTPNAKLSSDFLKLFENKSISIEITGIDKYKRTLARLYAPDYLNLKLVELGLSSKFLVSDSELKLFSDAEKSAVKNAAGIWNKSEYFGCFESEIDKYNEIIFLKNKCSYSINMAGWFLKDESRKTYTFVITLSNSGQINLHSEKGKDNSTDLFWQSTSPIWNNDRDTLYLFDAQGRLAHHEAYGY
jgi:endonuclease YncB( thermonuclease family)